MYNIFLFKLILLLCVSGSLCQNLKGPDPWDLGNGEITSNVHDNIPPDLKLLPKRRTFTESNISLGEWFFRRTLAIVLKGGQVKKNEDNSFDVSIQMRFDKERWDLLNEYIKSNNPLTDDMFRRSLGYLEESIYKPTITEKIIMAWSDYVQIYLIEYKMHITWSLGILAAIGVSIWLWNHMSHRHLIIIIVISLYIYEVIISYKEAEQQELDRFVSAVKKCKWFFWTSDCEVPPPDPIIFMKHMNPLKIGIRMCTTIVTEPMITISDTINTMIHGIADGLWFPFDKIVYGILVLCLNVSLMYLLIMIVFNYILNIPFNLNLGLLSIGVQQRNRRIFSNDPPTSAVPPVTQQTLDNNDRISGDNLQKLLYVCSRVLSSPSNNTQTTLPAVTNVTQNTSSTLRRSASTGRLPHVVSSSSKDMFALEGSLRKRKNVAFEVGSGDAS